MKPTIGRNNLSKQADGAQELPAPFPTVDCNYQAVVLPGHRGACLRPRFSSFRNISGDYFQNEARNEFHLEAVAFVAIVVTSAIPILNNMHALADFLRAISNL